MLQTERTHVEHLWDEVREMVWLASLIAGLSALAVGLAVALAVP